MYRSGPDWYLVYQSGTRGTHRVYGRVRRVGLVKADWIRAPMKASDPRSGFLVVGLGRPPEYTRREGTHCRSGPPPRACGALSPHCVRALFWGSLTPRPPVFIVDTYFPERTLLLPGTPWFLRGPGCPRGVGLGSPTAPLERSLWSFSRSLILGFHGVSWRFGVSPTVRLSR